MIQSFTSRRNCRRSSPVAGKFSLCCLLSILLNACHLLAMHDSYPLLYGSLRTYQTNACDTETIKFECDNRTVVGIVVVQYGQPAQPHMCRNVVAARAQQRQQQQQQNQQTIVVAANVMQRGNSAAAFEDTDYDGELMQADADPGSGSGGYKGRKGRFKANKALKNGNASKQPKCFDADRLRYNFLRKVERSCRDQHSCNVTLTPANLDLPVDPCAEHVKYAEVAYKCQPKIFRNKIVCEGNSTRLYCEHPDDRLAIFNAFFGARADLKSGHCLPPEEARRNSINALASYQNTSDRCEATGATETVMKLCSGRRECTVTASTDTFGVPKCQSANQDSSRPASFHMKLIHTCLSKEVLKPPSKPKAKPKATTSTTTTSTASSSTSTRKISTTTIATTSTALVPVVTSTTEGVDHLLEKSPPSSSSTTATHSVDRGEDDHDRDDDDDGEDQHRNLSEASNGNTSITNGTFGKTSADDEKEPQLILMDAVGSNSSPRSFGNDAQLNPHANCSELPASMQVIGFVSDWISALGFVKKNKERLILYLLVSLFGSMVCFLVVLSVKLYQQKKRTKQRAAENQTPPVAPFDIIDFDEDDLDDLDGLPSGPGGSGRGAGASGGGSGGQYPLETGTYIGPSHRQFSYHVPQETPSLSILASMAENNNNNNNASSTPTNSRPLLYSTLRKKPALKNTTTNTATTNTTTFAPVTGSETPWNTSASNNSSSSSRLLAHTQHYHPYQHQHQQQQQLLLSSEPPPTIIDYGLTLPSSMMPPPVVQSGGPISVPSSNCPGNTLPRKGILSNRHSTASGGSGILRHANTQTGDGSANLVDSAAESAGHGHQILVTVSSAAPAAALIGSHHSNSGPVVAFVDTLGVADNDNNCRMGSNISHGNYSLAGGYGDTDDGSGNGGSSLGFSTMRRVVPAVLSTNAANGAGGVGSATPLLITRFEERGLEMLELEQPGQQQHQQQQQQQQFPQGHTEPKTLSTSLNHFFM